MSTPFEVLAEQVLRLPAEERSELIDRVLASLESSPLDPEWERAWAEEVDRREADIASGKSQWLSGAQAMALARARST